MRDPLGASYLGALKRAKPVLIRMLIGRMAEFSPGKADGLKAHEAFRGLFIWQFEFNG